MVAIRFFQWLALLPVHIFMMALCCVLAPILPAFAIGRDTLPGWLSWFQTPDAPLDGDSGFAKDFPPDRYPQYYRRVRWLLRNPAYGFAWSVLSYNPKTLDFRWIGSLTPATRKSAGWFLIWQEDGHFEYSVKFRSLPELKLWKWTIRERMFYFRSGWKIVGLATDTGWKGDQKYVFTINPLDAA